MIKSLYTGVSGLNGSQSGLDVDSHNISNTNTVGYKSDRISFGDMFYNTKDVGSGVSVLDVSKSFNQGGLKQTGNDYDFAIEGKGFLTVADPMIPGSEYYTRDGSTRKSQDGYLVNSDGLHITGVTSTITGDKITSSHTQNLGSMSYDDGTSITTTNIYSTNYNNTATTTGVSGNNYKTASSNIKDIEALKTAYQNAVYNYSKGTTTEEAATSQQDTVGFTVADINDSSDILSININGVTYTQPFTNSAEDTLNAFSDKISTAEGISSNVDTTTGVVTIDSLIPGKTQYISNAKLNATVSTVTNTTAAAGDGKALVDSLEAELTTKVTAMGGDVVSNSAVLTKAATGTVALSSIQLDLDALGLSENGFGDIEVDDGNIYLKQGEARFIIAQIAPVQFTNEQGLNPVGNNLYEKTLDSGDPQYIQGISSVENKMLELSNAQLSEELVNLMVHQKSFEANSKSITTSDELLQTAINLKK